MRSVKDPKVWEGSGFHPDNYSKGITLNKILSFCISLLVVITIVVNS